MDSRDCRLDAGYGRAYPPGHHQRQPVGVAPGRGGPPPGVERHFRRRSSLPPCPRPPVGRPLGGAACTSRHERVLHAARPLGPRQPAHCRADLRGGSAPAVLLQSLCGGGRRRAGRSPRGPPGSTRAWRPVRTRVEQGRRDEGEHQDGRLDAGLGLWRGEEAKARGGSVG